MSSSQQNSMNLKNSTQSGETPTTLPNISTIRAQLAQQQQQQQPSNLSSSRYSNSAATTAITTTQPTTSQTSSTPSTTAMITPRYTNSTASTLPLQPQRRFQPSSAVLTRQETFQPTSSSNSLSNFDDNLQARLSSSKKPQLSSASKSIQDALTEDQLQHFDTNKQLQSHLKPQVPLIPLHKLIQNEEKISGIQFPSPASAQISSKSTAIAAAAPTKKSSYYPMSNKPIIPTLALHSLSQMQQPLQHFTQFDLHTPCSSSDLSARSITSNSSETSNILSRSQIMELDMNNEIEGLVQKITQFTSGSKKKKKPKQKMVMQSLDLNASSNFEQQPSSQRNSKLTTTTAHPTKSIQQQPQQYRISNFGMELSHAITSTPRMPVDIPMVFVSRRLNLEEACEFERTEGLRFSVDSSTFSEESYKKLKQIESAFSDLDALVASAESIKEKIKIKSNDEGELNGKAATFINTEIQTLANKSAKWRKPTTPAGLTTANLPATSSSYLPKISLKDLCETINSFPNMKHTHRMFHMKLASTLKEITSVDDLSRSLIKESFISQITSAQFSLIESILCSSVSNNNNNNKNSTNNNNTNNNKTTTSTVMTTTTPNITSVISSHQNFKSKKKLKSFLVKKLEEIIQLCDSFNMTSHKEKYTQLSLLAQQQGYLLASNKKSNRSIQQQQQQQQHLHQQQTSSSSQSQQFNDDQFTEDTETDNNAYDADYNDIYENGNESDDNEDESSSSSNSNKAAKKRNNTCNIITNLKLEVTRLKSELEESRKVSEQLIGERLKDFNNIRESQQRMELFKQKLETKIGLLKQQQQQFVQLFRQLAPNSDLPVDTSTFQAIDFFQIKDQIIDKMRTDILSETQHLIGEKSEIQRQLTELNESVQQIKQISYNTNQQFLANTTLMNTERSYCGNSVSPPRGMFQNTNLINHINTMSSLIDNTHMSTQQKKQQHRSNNNIHHSFQSQNHPKRSRAFFNPPPPLNMSLCNPATPIGGGSNSINNQIGNGQENQSTCRSLHQHLVDSEMKQQIQEEQRQRQQQQQHHLNSNPFTFQQGNQQLNPRTKPSSTSNAFNHNQNRFFKSCNAQRSRRMNASSTPPERCRSEQSPTPHLQSINAMNVELNAYRKTEGDTYDSSFFSAHHNQFSQFQQAQINLPQHQNHNQSTQNQFTPIQQCKYHRQQQQQYQLQQQQQREQPVHEQQQMQLCQTPIHINETHLQCNEIMAIQSPRQREVTSSNNNNLEVNACIPQQQQPTQQASMNCNNPKHISLLESSLRTICEFLNSSSSQVQLFEKQPPTYKFPFDEDDRLLREIAIQSAIEQRIPEYKAITDIFSEQEQLKQQKLSFTSQLEQLKKDQEGLEKSKQDFTDQLTSHKQAIELFEREKLEFTQQKTQFNLLNSSLTQFTETQQKLQTTIELFEKSKEEFTAFKQTYESNQNTLFESFKVQLDKSNQQTLSSEQHHLNVQKDQLQLDRLNLNKEKELHAKQTTQLQLDFSALESSKLSLSIEQTKLTIAQSELKKDKEYQINQIESLLTQQQSIDKAKAELALNTQKLHDLQTELHKQQTALSIAQSELDQNKRINEQVRISLESEQSNIKSTQASLEKQQNQLNESRSNFERALLEFQELELTRQTTEAKKHHDCSTLLNDFLTKSEAHTNDLHTRIDSERQRDITLRTTALQQDLTQKIEAIIKATFEKQQTQFTLQTEQELKRIAAELQSIQLDSSIDVLVQQASATKIRAAHLDAQDKEIQHQAQINLLKDELAQLHQNRLHDLSENVLQQANKIAASQTQSYNHSTNPILPFKVLYDLSQFLANLQHDKKEHKESDSQRTTTTETILLPAAVALHSDDNFEQWMFQRTIVPSQDQSRKCENHFLQKIESLLITNTEQISSKITTTVSEQAQKTLQQQITSEQSILTKFLNEISANYTSLAGTLEKFSTDLSGQISSNSSQAQLSLASSFKSESDQITSSISSLSTNLISTIQSHASNVQKSLGQLENKFTQITDNQLPTSLMNQMRVILQETTEKIVTQSQQEKQLEKIKELLLSHESTISANLKVITSTTTSDIQSQKEQLTSSITQEILKSIEAATQNTQSTTTLIKEQFEAFKNNNKELTESSAQSINGQFVAQNQELLNSIVSKITETSQNSTTSIIESLSSNFEPLVKTTSLDSLQENLVRLFEPSKLEVTNSIKLSCDPLQAALKSIEQTLSNQDTTHSSQINQLAITCNTNKSTLQTEMESLKSLVTQNSDQTAKLLITSIPSIETKICQVLSSLQSKQLTLEESRLSEEKQHLNEIASLQSELLKVKLEAQQVLKDSKSEWEQSTASQLTQLTNSHKKSLADLESTHSSTLALLKSEIEKLTQSLTNHQSESESHLKNTLNSFELERNQHCLELATITSARDTLKLQLTQSEQTHQQQIETLQKKQEETLEKQRNLAGEEKQRTIVEYETRIKSLESQHIKSLEEHQISMNLLEEKHERELQELKQNYDSNSLASSSKHSTDLTTIEKQLKDAHATQLHNLKLQFQTEISTRLSEQSAHFETVKSELLSAADLNSKQALQLALTQQQDSLTISFNESLAQHSEKHESSLKSLNESHTQSLESLRVSHESQIKQLAESHAITLKQLQTQSSETLTQKLKESTESHQKSIESYESRMKSLVDSHTTQLHQLEASNTQTIKEMHDTQAQQLAELTLSHSNKLETLKQSHQKQIESLTQQHAFLITELKDNHERAINEIVKSHATQLESLQSSHAATINDFQEAQFASTKELQQSHAMKIEEIKSTHALNVEELKRIHAETLKDIKESYATSFNESKATHTAHVTKLNEQHSQKLNELEEQLNSKLESLSHEHSKQTQQLTITHTNSLKDLQRQHEQHLSESLSIQLMQSTEQHRQECATLQSEFQRNLFESESRLTSEITRLSHELSEERNKCSLAQLQIQTLTAEQERKLESTRLAYEASISEANALRSKIESFSFGSSTTVEGLLEKLTNGQREATRFCEDLTQERARLVTAKIVHAELQTKVETLESVLQTTEKQCATLRKKQSIAAKNSVARIKRIGLQHIDQLDGFLSIYQSLIRTYPNEKVKEKFIEFNFSAIVSAFKSTKLEILASCESNVKALLHVIDVNKKKESTASISSSSSSSSSTSATSKRHNNHSSGATSSNHHQSFCSTTSSGGPPDDQSHANFDHIIEAFTNEIIKIEPVYFMLDKFHQNISIFLPA